MCRGLLFLTVFLLITRWYLSESREMMYKNKKVLHQPSEGGEELSRDTLIYFFLKICTCFFFHCSQNFATIFKFSRYCAHPPLLWQQPSLATALDGGNRCDSVRRKNNRWDGVSWWTPRGAFRAELVRRSKRAVKWNVGRRTRLVRLCKRVFVSLPMRSPILYARVVFRLG